MSNNPDTEVLDADVENLDSEGSTKSGDITEGSLLGAVGGGIVGALAGGPIGAVVGAVLGAGASGVAIDVMDNHDEDEAGRYGTRPLGNTLAIREEPVISSPTSVEIDETVRRDAYDLWEQRGHRDGCDVDDWLEAERSYRNKTSIFSS